MGSSVCSLTAFLQHNARSKRVCPTPLCSPVGLVSSEHTPYDPHLVGMCTVNILHSNILFYFCRIQLLLTLSSSLAYILYCIIILYFPPLSLPSPPFPSPPPLPSSYLSLPPPPLFFLSSSVLINKPSRSTMCRVRRHSVISDITTGLWVRRLDQPVLSPFTLTRSV